MTASNAINPSQLAALAAAQNKPAATATTVQSKEAPEVAKEPEIKGRVFFCEFGVFESFLSPTGVPVTFYKGFAVVEDPELIQFVKTLKAVKDVTDTVKRSELPVPPKRERSRNWASRVGDPTVFNPLDLLNRAVLSSAGVTQAQASNSK